MKNWEQTLVTTAASVREALDRIDRTGSQIALVVDESRCLLGTLSDGDVRRALLKGASLGDSVSTIMHVGPTCAAPGENRRTIRERMQRLGLRQIPIVDAGGIVVGLEIDSDLQLPEQRPNQVVIMAGGLGSRLGELTQSTPKPMLKVGPRPLLETIVRSFAEHGFRHVALAVNYKAEQIESHFGDGSAFGIDVRYLREKQRMGTAGALSLLPERPAEPFIVTNADLLTRADYGAMVDQHAASGADATMAVRQYEMQVPFGVVFERDGRVDSIEEKPMQAFVVSAGMYVFSPQVLNLVPRDEYFDMPSLFTRLIERGMHARTHSIDGYWLDIGRMHDYEKANDDFTEVFR